MSFHRRQHSAAGLRSWARRTERRPTIGGKLTSSALAALTGADVDRMIRNDPESRRREIQRLHALGRSTSEIARELRIDPAAVRAALAVIPTFTRES
jgi:DNA-binding NarL/FixJ family response regulator